MGGREARAAALRALVEYERRDAYLNLLLPSVLAEAGLQRRDRALVTEIVQGTVRMILALDWALARFSSRPLDSLEPGVRWLLRMSAYQLLYMSVPAYAVCDIAAEVARSELGERTVRFVHGVLRALARGLDSVEWPDRVTEPARYLEIRHSHPAWVVEMWIEELGFEKAEALCEADNLQPPLSLRCNLLRTGREDLERALAAGGAEAVDGPLAPEAVLVRGSGAIRELPEYGRGMFAVQDQGSMVVGHRVGPRAGSRALDLCAAPGGKANHMAELMGNEGEVLAVDVNPSRLELVRGEAARLGNRAVRTVAMDARRARDGIEGHFDRVLVDAPCTGLGTLARRPDTRWRRRPSEVAELAALQSEILREAGRMVARGGRLVYSTCTISRRENQDVVEGFLERAPGFSLAGPGSGPGWSGGYTRLFPDTEGCDGMFIAVMYHE